MSANKNQSQEKVKARSKLAAAHQESMQSRGHFRTEMHAHYPITQSHKRLLQTTSVSDLKASKPAKREERRRRMRVV